MSGGTYHLYSKRIFLLAELNLLFIGIPTLLYFWTPTAILPLLWIFAAGCGALLLKDPHFDRTELWRSTALGRDGSSMVRQVAAGGAVLTAAVYLFAPDLLFSLARQKPVLWILILLLYPLLSVYPQELIYRTYFFHRYRTLLPDRRLMILVNALLFGYMHIIFQNWIAVGLTAIGGVLFAVTYERSRSTLLVSIAHSLFGGLIFTLGLGQFFYIGTISTISSSFRL